MNFRDAATKVIVKAMIAKGYLDVWSMHRNTVNARKKNEKLLRKIIRTNRNSEYGKRYDFSSIKSAEDYRSMVPLSTYTDYDPYITRMIDNSQDGILTSLKVVGYAQSSGSVGVRKYVPLTNRDLRIYTKYTVTRMLAIADKYKRKHGGGGLKPFRGMYTGPAYDNYLPNGMICSNVPDVSARKLGFLFPYILNIPFSKMFNTKQIDYRYNNFRFALSDRNTLYLFGVFFKDISDLFKYLENNWRTLADDIEKGEISSLAKASPETVKKLKKVIKPMPERAAEIRREFEKGVDDTILKRVWPNMSVISGIGTSTFEPFGRIAKTYTQGIPYDYSIYGASEGLIAACDELESPKQLLLVDSCYYEFIPLDDESRILSLDELEIGKQYEIVITNQAGLYRYRLADVVKVVDYMNDCPYVTFSYRKGQLLNLTGEKTTEEHMRAVVKRLEEAAGCEVTHWAVYNCVTDHPYHYVLLAENEEGRDLSVYSDLVDDAVREINPRYRDLIELGKMDKVAVHNLEPGTGNKWMEMKVASGVPAAQVKPVRIIDTPEKEEFFIGKVMDQQQ